MAGPGRNARSAREWVGVEESARCSVCTRTPLVGESVTIRREGRRESAVCDLCTGKPRATALGEPVRRERVRTSAGAAGVRRVIPQPVPVTRPRAPAAPVP